MIELANVSRSFSVGGRQIFALKPTTLSIKRGEFVVVLGPSGSGKSTFLHLIGLMEAPSSGSVFINGNDTAKMADAEASRFRGRYLGFVFQTFNLLARKTVLENVLLPSFYAGIKSGDSIPRAHSLLETLGLSHRLHHRPSQLSGGERQRAAIARSLINDPLILLADEPTGNLDSQSATEVIHTLQRINAKGTTVLMVTHNLELAGAGTRVIRVSDGEVKL